MKSSPCRLRPSFGRARLFGIVLLVGWVFPASLFAAGGDLDATFDPGLGPGSNGGAVRAIAIQPDGKILLGGAFMTMDAPGVVAQNGITRLNPDGTRDTSFNFGFIGASDTVHAIALQ